MSGLLFPSLIGQTLDVVRSYRWKTGYQEALSGKQSTIQYAAYPLVHFELTFELLRDNVSPSDLRAIVGLHNQLAGRYDTFLFTDPDFNSVTAQAFGTSTGSTSTQYPLVASFENSGGPGALELVQNLNGTPTLYDNGTAISGSHYTISSTGVVQFSTSPTSGHALTWTGSFYYRCRFDEDTIEWTKFMQQWWLAKKVAFTSVIL